MQNDLRNTVPDDQFANAPFRFADLRRAAGYPLRFRLSFLLGSSMFVVCTIGVSFVFTGGLLPVVLGSVCAMFALMLTFSILANTASNFNRTKTDADFMPAWFEGSLQEKAIRPFLFGVAATVSSFGPFIILAITGTYLVAGAISERERKFSDELVRLPGTQYYAPNRTAEQTQQVKELISQVDRQNERQFSRNRKPTEVTERETLSTDDFDQVPAEESTNVHAFDRRDKSGLTQSTAAALLPPAEDEGFRQVVKGILSLEAPLVVASVIAFLWGLFYFPLACVSGHCRRSLREAFDPRIGIDTVRKLGLAYLNLLSMWLILVAAAFFAVITVRVALFPFYLSSVGNIPATALGGTIVFYCFTVFSCLLGYFLLEFADKLRVYR